MKTKITVKTKISKLIRVYGSKAAVAKLLRVDISYVYKMLNGQVVGERLYRDICKAVDGESS